MDVEGASYDGQRIGLGVDLLFDLHFHWCVRENKIVLCEALWDAQVAVDHVGSHLLGHTAGVRQDAVGHAGCDQFGEGLSCSWESTPPSVDDPSGVEGDGR